jgi:hypothetical protein
MTQQVIAGSEKDCLLLRNRMYLKRLHEVHEARSTRINSILLFGSDGFPTSWRHFAIEGGGNSKFNFM